ncbi:hypothetical protein INR49_010911 [Caranx melampygus]|nr:hypothetical protein INR49_010911 [Caranx melampygus]
MWNNKKNKEGGFILKAQVHAMEVNVSQALGISSGSCLQDSCMFVPLLDSQASSSSGGDRHVAINRTISHSASWSSSLANSLHSGITEPDQQSAYLEPVNQTEGRGGVSISGPPLPPVTMTTAVDDDGGGGAGGWGERSGLRRGGEEGEEGRLG